MLTESWTCFTVGETTGLHIAREGAVVADGESSSPAIRAVSPPMWLLPCREEAGGRSAVIFLEWWARNFWEFLEEQLQRHGVSNEALIH